MDFFQKEFWGNTIMRWGISFGILFLAILIGKIFHWFFKNIAHKAAKKTASRWDDLIIDMVEEPIVFVSVLFGARIGLQILHMPVAVREWVSRAFFMLVALAVAWLITRFLDAVVERILRPLAQKSEGDLDDQLLPIIKKGLKLITWSLAIIVGINNAGYDVGALLAGLGLGGLAFALAAKDTIANLFGGFTIFMDRPFTMGDRVKIDSYEGIVEEIGLRSTRIRTLEGRTVTLPNSSFTDRPVENVSSEPTRKVTLNLGLTYDTDENAMKKAMDLLKEISAANEDIEEKILLSFNAFGDFSLGILFIYYIKKGSNIFETQTDMNIEILSQFNKEKLEFAFPTQTIYSIGSQS